MNLDLILENIRLGHIEALLLEATTDLEVVRGQRLINESIMQLRSILMEENTFRNNVKNDSLAGGVLGTMAGAVGAPIAGAIIGGAVGNSVHGSDGINPTTGVVYNAQAHNDDEYDMTGAVIGGLAGATGIGRIAGAGAGAGIGAGLGAGVGVARNLYRR